MGCADGVLHVTLYTTVWHRSGAQRTLAKHTERDVQVDTEEIPGSSGGAWPCSPLIFEGTDPTTGDAFRHLQPAGRVCASVGPSSLCIWWRQSEM